jgi:hypothetical protein
MPCCTTFTKCLSKTGVARFPQPCWTSLVWQTCPSCGREHGRAHCPHCAQPQVTPIAKPGRVQMTSVFQTAGFIVYATQSQGQLRWVYWDAGTFYREDGTPLLQGDRLPHLRWQHSGRSHLAGL